MFTWLDLMWCIFTLIVFCLGFWLGHEWDDIIDKFK